MRVGHYLCIIICLVGLGMTTVAEHARRVRIGYEIRRLEREQVRLRRQRQTLRLMWEQGAAPETVAARASALGIAREEEVEALMIAADGRQGRGR